MLTLAPVHEFRTDPRTKRRVLAKENHYHRLVVEGHPEVVVQGGRVMYADGADVESPLPEWLRAALYRVTDEGLRQVGLSRTSLEPPVVAAAAEPVAPLPEAKPEAPPVPQPARKRGVA